MIIQTKRLLLRKFTNEDFEDFCEYAIDDEMCRMMGRDMMHSKDDALRNFEWLKDKEERCYGLVDKLSNRVIGNLTVVNVPSELISMKNLKGKNGKSLSFSISKEFQRKGLMQEAILGVIKQLFYEEGMDYIQCGSYPFNKASEALQKKLGFTYLTTLEFKDGDKAVTTNENILWKE